MEGSPSLGKRKLSQENLGDESKEEESVLKKPNSTRTCVHEVAVPSGYTAVKDESIHGTLSDRSLLLGYKKLYINSLTVLLWHIRKRF